MARLAGVGHGGSRRFELGGQGGRRRVPRAGVALAALLLAGCSFEPGAFPDSVVGPIEANAVECACTYSDAAMRGLRVRASSDDAEQVGTAVQLDSADLDLGSEHVGLRFDGIALPPGATITGAFVQFTADDTSAATTTVEIRAQVDAAAPTFTTAASDLTARTPLSASPVAWNVPAWINGTSGAAQRTPDLAPLLQELVDLPGWRSDSPVVLIVDQGTGQRVAESFDGDPTDAPRLVVNFTTSLAATVPTCASDLTRDGDGFLTAPAATCATLQTTLGGLNAACGLPQAVTCTLVDRVDPNGDALPDSFQSDFCATPCTPDAVDAPGCTEYDPVEFVDCLERGNPLATCKELHVSATHAGADTPVCVASGSPLAFHALGRRTTCEVGGTSAIAIGDEEPEQDPDTEGVIEILGGPCPGGGCLVHPSFLLDMEPITFEVRFASDPVFEDLAVAGSGVEAASLDSGLATFEAEEVEGTGIGRSGDEGMAVAATNAEALDVGVDWGGRTCNLHGTLTLGVGDDGVCEADDTVPCRSDDDCVGVGGACLLPPADADEMSATLAVGGPLVNQPPTAVAGAPVTVECTSTAGASFALDGGGSTDPDGDLALASWRMGSRTGPEISDDLRAEGALGIGGSETYWLRVIDTHAQLDEAETSVSVVDTTGPVVACNAPATIRPRDAVLELAATATDVCDADVPAEITSYDCFAFTARGRRVSKLGSCVVSFADDTLRIEDVGGIGTHITWTVEATDDSGNLGSTTCEAVVER